MTQEEKQQLLQGMFQGADLRGAQIIAVNEGEVYYQKYGAGSKKSEEGPSEKPDALQTEEATQAVSLLVKARLLQENWQPNGLSGSERGLLAKALCDRLEITQVWQVFGSLWNEKPETLRRYFNNALEQRKSLEFQEKLKNILG